MTAAELSPLLPILNASECAIIDLEQGYVSCPGGYWHTTPTKHSDCKLFDNGNGFFQIHCHHTSCGDRVKLLNKILAALAKQGRNRAKPVDHDSEKIDAAEVIAEIVTDFAWPYDQIVADGGPGIHEPPEAHYLQMFGLFEDDDIVWCGRSVYDTGSSKHHDRFRPVREWLAETSCPGSFIAPSTFVSGCYSRCEKNVSRRKFLVVESDKLSRDDIGSLFRWLGKSGLQLRAVIDTAGKSLHGWFDYPATGVLAQLKHYLPRLGCDPAMFNPSQPCRLPGALRDGRYQRLIFIA